MATSVLLLGHGAREHAIAEAICRSRREPILFAYMASNNPGIAGLAREVRIGRYSDLDAIVAFAKACNAEFAMVGPEDPLSQGAVDALEAAGIPAVGPTKSLARLESSKSFTRNLVAKYAVPGNPAFGVFTSMDGIAEFLATLPGAVVKPDGLTGGKGVMVQGDHFTTSEEALEICRAILAEHPSVTVEEKLIGEEFSLQCITDGVTVVPTPPVQDHKRRFEGDTGPNTGGMGSYSCENHALPFITAQDVADGLEITRQVAAAILKETGRPYKGVMYGGFMITPQGVRLLEYNARFGDPEAMNILPLLETDFVDLARAIIAGTLKDLPVTFAKKASVVKYIVPKGYGLPADHPDASSTAAKIEIGDVGKANLYFASVDQRPDGLYMSSSRAIGVVGAADTLAEAERIAEAAVKAIAGPVAHRKDIGTADLIAKRVQHMDAIRKGA